MIRPLAPVTTMRLDVRLDSESELNVTVAPVPSACGSSNVRVPAPPVIVMVVEVGSAQTGAAPVLPRKICPLVAAAAVVMRPLAPVTTTRLDVRLDSESELNVTVAPVPSACGSSKEREPAPAVMVIVVEEGRAQVGALPVLPM